MHTPPHVHHIPPHASVRHLTIQPADAERECLCSATSTSTGSSLVDQLLVRILPAQPGTAASSLKTRTVFSALDDNLAADLQSPTKHRQRMSSMKATTAAGLLAALFYGAVAVSMNFISKWNLTMTPTPFVILLVQSLATLAVMQPLISLKRLSLPPFSRPRASSLFLLCQLYTANTACGLYALRSLNIPMFSSFKRMTPMAVLIAKACMTRRAPPRAVTVAVSLVFVGTIMASMSDMASNGTGYLFALLSCAAQAAHLLMTEQQAEAGVTTSELLYYNAIASLPMVVSGALLSGELSALPMLVRTAVATHGFLQPVLALLLISVMGCILNYSLFLCTMINSALTTTIVGVLKSVFTILLGFTLMGGAPVTFLNLSGISLNTTGGVLYSVHKYWTARAVGAAKGSHPKLVPASPNQEIFMVYAGGQSGRGIVDTDEDGSMHGLIPAQRGVPRRVWDVESGSDDGTSSGDGSSTGGIMGGVDVSDWQPAGRNGAPQQAGLAPGLRSRVGAEGQQWYAARLMQPLEQSTR